MLRLALVLAMSLSLCIPAFAVETSPDSKDTPVNAGGSKQLFHELEELLPQVKRKWVLSMPLVVLSCWALAAVWRTGAFLSLR